MLTKIRSLTIYVTPILLCLCAGKHVESASGFVGTVSNLSVTALLDERYVENNDTYKFLRLNISWLPPNNTRLPSSYSVIVTGIQTEKDTNTLNCREKSIFYTVNNGRQQSVLLPTNNIFVDMPDFHIQPNCSYKVQVIANPRPKFLINPAEIVYTVPECIGHECACINAKLTLPIPNVNVIQRGNQIVINWNVTKNTPDVHFYIISIGVPLLLSNNGLTLYNMTRIGKVSAEKSMFFWDLRSNNQNIDIKDGYKVAVIAMNNHSCFGTEGYFIVHTASSDTKIWFIVTGLMIACILLGILSFLLCHNNHFFMMYYHNSRMRSVSKCKSQWVETLLQKHNILYVQYESEGDCKEETDKMQAPFKTVKLIDELGSGNFGNVYLGHLDDANNTLVAIKMSQETNMIPISDIRQQFIEEIEIMKKAGTHPHLVSLIGYCIQPNKPICILLEYMQGGDLLTYLHLKKKSQVDKVINNERTLKSLNISQMLYSNLSSTTSEKTNIYELKQYVPTYMNINNNYNKRETKNAEENWTHQIEKHQFLKFATEIAMGMEHLETKGIIHRDLAARNILLDANLTLKISDFGLSRNGIYVIKNDRKKRHLPIRWMSPETIQDRAFSSKSDVWSYGIVLWEIGTMGAFPYSNVSDDCLSRHIIGNGRLEQPDGVSLDIYKIMCSCWSMEPEDRPDFTQLLSELQVLTTSNSFTSVPNPSYGTAQLYHLLMMADIYK
ncbi:uncharacterized protein LOC143180047 [Calliopsis andreniformis]|uniref:uncharacterized protein LOC143180047 n=1 Tax=Calliopsis andreniformis TaxID=337506 RepID=UPI003FCCEF12